MSTVAVIAHTGKTIGGGLTELRSTLALEGVTDPLWYEIPKSRKAPKRAKLALEEGADLVMVWGGDGTVQRCVDALAGSGVPIAIIPAGTANLFASNLGIPKDIAKAVRIGLHGERRPIDVGRINGERFAVMAGTGLDAFDDPRRGCRAEGPGGAPRVRRDRGTAPQGPSARGPDPGRWHPLVSGQGRLRPVRQRAGHPGRHHRVRRCPARRRPAGDRHRDRRRAPGVDPHPGANRGRSGRAVAVRRHHLGNQVRGEAGPQGAAWELDGGDREPTKRLEVEIEPGAITVCVDPRVQG